MKSKIFTCVLLILMAVMFFIFGVAFAKTTIHKELQSGPVYSETELTTYLQTLYESSYKAGAMKGVSMMFGDESDASCEYYYQWMQKYLKDPEGAINDEGKVFLESSNNLNELFEAYLRALS